MAKQTGCQRALYSQAVVYRPKFKYTLEHTWDSVSWLYQRPFPLCAPSKCTNSTFKILHVSGLLFLLTSTIHDSFSEIFWSSSLTDRGTQDNREPMLGIQPACNDPAAVSSSAQLHLPTPCFHPGCWVLLSTGHLISPTLQTNFPCLCLFTFLSWPGLLSFLPLHFSFLFLKKNFFFKAYPYPPLSFLS